VHSGNICPFREYFSREGLTIAEDRESLALDTANELIFLQDALHGIQKYFEAQVVQE
jgi:hypothetical protein